MLEAIQFILYIAIIVINVVSVWLIFQKANLPGWYSIIPIYGQYKFYELAGKKKWYVALLIVTLIFLPIFIGLFIVSMISMINNASIIPLIFLFIISSIVVIFSFVCNVIFALGLTEKFNQSIPFAIGLLLLPSIFFAILAFSKDIKYINFQSQSLNNQHFTPENGYSSKLNINNDGYTMSDNLNNPYNEQNN